MKKAVLSIILAISLQSMNGQMQQAIERIAGEYGLMGLSVVAVCDGKITGEWYTDMRDYDINLNVEEKTK